MYLLKKSRDGKSDGTFVTIDIARYFGRIRNFDIFGIVNLYQKIAADRIGITQLREPIETVIFSVTTRQIDLYVYFRNISDYSRVRLIAIALLAILLY